MENKRSPFWGIKPCNAFQIFPTFSLSIFYKDVAYHSSQILLQTFHGPLLNPLTSAGEAHGGVKGAWRVPPEMLCITCLKFCYELSKVLRLSLHQVQEKHMGVKGAERAQLEMKI